MKYLSYAVLFGLYVLCQLRVVERTGFVAAHFDPWCDEDNPRVVTFNDISAAAYRIKNFVVHTACRKSQLSEELGSEVFFKEEFLQFTGSFKERGVRNAFTLLPPDQKKAGVVAASTGNHAQAVAYHGSSMGLKTMVVMPIVAPVVKIQKCHELGANVIVHGDNLKVAREFAIGIAKKEKKAYINGYDHPDIIAGQGTVGIEVLYQVPDLDAIIVPVGGGSLLAGTITAIKHIKPHVQCYGVESETCASFTEALKAGKAVTTVMKSTIADGLAVPLVGYNSYATASLCLDICHTVTEEQIARALLSLVEQERVVVEGAAACGVALLMSGKVPELKNKKVVILLTGGNIDTTALGRCVERGLATDNRLIKLKVTFRDQPIGLSRLLSLISEVGASVKDTRMEKSYIVGNVFNQRVVLICETGGKDMAERLKTMLKDNFEDWEIGNETHGLVKQ